MLDSHTHEWEWPDNLAIPHCRDAACNEILQSEEIVRRLNATERLSADAADYAAEFTQAGTNKHGMDQESEGNIYYLTDSLRAYAAALEGEDD